MHNQDYLSSSEQLSALLDGELDVSEAGSLFFELAHNEDLQQEMQQHIQVRNMFKKSITPPPSDLKRNIFAGLGIAGASTAAASAKTPGAGSSFIYGKPLLVAATSLLASAITALVMTFGSPEGDSESRFADHIAPADAVQPASFAMAMPTSAERSAENLINESNPAISERNFEAPAASQPEIAENHKFNSSGNKDISRAQVPVYILQTRPQIMPTGYISPEPAVNAKGEDFVNLFEGVSLGVRGFSATSIPDFGVPSLHQPALNNLSLALGYDLTDNHAFGLEVGQENFQQKYSGTDTEGKFRIDQNYLAFWGGAYYQYSLDKSEALAGIQPFARVFVGATRIGPLQKNLVGLQYKYGKQFSIYGGLETTVLLYQYQGELYTSQKFGLTYGLNVHF
ncbi:MAG: hypothetical protein ACLFQX_01760 [Candidatus Kapaibacterium sp.]